MLFFLIKLSFICPLRFTVYPFSLLAVCGRLVFMNRINAYPLASGWVWLRGSIPRILKSEDEIFTTVAPSLMGRCGLAASPYWRSQLLG